MIILPKKGIVCYSGYGMYCYKLNPLEVAFYKSVIARCTGVRDASAEVPGIIIDDPVSSRAAAIVRLA